MGLILTQSLLIFQVHKLCSLDFIFAIQESQNSPNKSLANITEIAVYYTTTGNILYFPCSSTFYNVFT